MKVTPGDFADDLCLQRHVALDQDHEFESISGVQVSNDVLEKKKNLELWPVL
jgi:hypothetical protein